MTDTTLEKALVITRVLEAPRELVWRAWSEPERVMQWWGPEHFTAPSATMDFRVGGQWLYCMRGPDGKDLWSTGTYQEIVEHERIVTTDSFADEDGNPVLASHYGIGEDIPLEMTLTITFEDVDDGTKLTIEHVGIPAGELHTGAELGWGTSLDKLAASLS